MTCHCFKNVSRMSRSSLKSEFFIVGIFLLLSDLRIAAADFAETAIDQRLSQAAQIASSIQIDGHDDDWAGIPACFDASGDAGGDASRDLISTRVLANTNGLYVCVRTLGTPSRYNYAFGFKWTLWICKLPILNSLPPR
jgi:hypothetical protein